jgi:hypothetical protein
MYTQQQLHAFRSLVTTVHRLMLLAMVRSYLFDSSKHIYIYDVIIVRIWDTVGNEQVLKAEYKVLSGRMYVHCMFLLSMLLKRGVQKRSSVGWRKQTYRGRWRWTREVNDPLLRHDVPF